MADRRYALINHTHTDLADEYVDGISFNTADGVLTLTRAIGADLTVDLDGRYAVSGAVDHGALSGLGDDDHPQYHNDARGDARYLQLSGGTLTGDLFGTKFRAQSGAEFTDLLYYGVQGNRSSWYVTNAFTNGYTYFQTQGQWVWRHTDGTQRASLDQTGKLTLTGRLVLPGNDNFDGALSIEGANPTIRFQDVGGEYTHWLHNNTNRLYVLVDRNGDNVWDSPHPLELNSATNVGYLYGQTIATQSWTNGAFLPLTGGSLTGTLNITPAGGSYNTHFALGANYDNYLTHGASGRTQFRSYNGSVFTTLAEFTAAGLAIHPPRDASDLNSWAGSSSFRATDGANANLPSGTAYTCVLQLNNLDVNAQLLFDRQEQSGTVWWRSKAGSSYTGAVWKEIHHTGKGIYPEGQGTGHIRAVTGDYGSIEVEGADGSSGTWRGVSIGGRHVFMDNGGTVSGLYDDTNSDWLIQCNDNAAVWLYYNGVPTLRTSAQSASTQTTGAEVYTGRNVWENVGMNQQSSVVKNVTYTFNINDAGVLLYHNSSTAHTWTTPNSTSGADFPNGVTYNLYNAGTGAVTIAAGSGVTLRWVGDNGTGATGNRTLNQYRIATLVKTANTEWLIWGSVT